MLSPLSTINLSCRARPLCRHDPVEVREARGVSSCSVMFMNPGPPVLMMNPASSRLTGLRFQDPPPGSSSWGPSRPASPSSGASTSRTPGTGSGRWWRPSSGSRADLPYGERVSLLSSQRIALWDVVASCRREGSGDAAIRDPVVNDIPGFLRTHPSIRLVALNGSTAGRLFHTRISAPGSGQN